MSFKEQSMQKEFIFVGTYTQPILFGTGDILQGKGEGVYVLELDCATGALHFVCKTTDIANPSYLAFSPDGRFLYAVNELKRWQGGEGGTVSAFRIVPETKKLQFLGSRPTLGTDPCHVVVNAKNTHVFVSNFMSGSVTVFPIMKDGSLGEKTDFRQHEGSSVHPTRQKGPHAHSLTFDPAQKYAFVPDLGLDKVLSYLFDDKTGRLLPAPVPYFETAPGSGPRHCEFHPSGKFCYLINEIASSISLLAYDSEAGSFEKMQTVSTIPSGYAGENICADLHITPDGLFLYGSNRGHNSLAGYRIHRQDGTLTPLSMIGCGGKTPRNFAVSKNGRILIVANQDSDNLVTFQIDTESGALTKLCETALPTPVCVKSILL
ncbi:MAG: lactonase family protein [Ruthenibacterium sp.]